MPMSRESAALQVHQAARTAAYHKGPAFKFDDIRSMVPSDIGDRFVAEQAELCGFPVWTSVPDEVLQR